MSSIRRARITLLANHNRNVSTVFVLSLEGTPASCYNSIVTAARNKLRLKCKMVYLMSTGEVVTKENCLKVIENGSVLVVSKGEALQGAIRPETPTVGVIGLDTLTINSTLKKPLLDVLIVKSWLEDEGEKQLRTTAKSLPQVVAAVGMPDLHPGKRYPIGAVYATEGVLYPMLVGGDIGCGMILLETNMKSSRATEKQVEKWCQNLVGVDRPLDAFDISKSIEWSNNSQTIQPVVEELFQKHGIDLNKFNPSLGTVGAGNHFAEFQVIEHIYDRAIFEEKTQLNSESLFLLVHSGSRGLGAAILKRHIDSFGEVGLASDSPEANDYLELHDAACEWARHNRRLIAKRVLERIGGSLDESRCVLDIWHNNVSAVSCTMPTADNDKSEGDKPGEEWKCSKENRSDEMKSSPTTRKLWLHRKGAAPSNQGLVVIPGSRGSLSYLVQPIEPRLGSGFSLAHGAGRKWHRSKALASGKSRYPNPEVLRTTPLRGKVVCTDKNLLYEEAPDAYKDIDAVVSDLVDLGFVKVAASFRPVLSYKTSS
uniref:3'-phosphate/5'-hydroxy nucleic acid ligase n=2 Tax=Aplanochytrium stocchinoi TaxID=215587 RepID=A0A7S3LN51_9STRA|mmetsp:Transcript_26934/g.32605  ORF Transcript_26934/g.32605 Transcript_26934/m.32605 type:complete len:540 (+) Transcript_26934:112-1731(+)